MSKVCSFSCAGYIFDIYDNDRIPVGLSKNKYYVVPSMHDNLKLWMFDKAIEKISTKEHMQELIEIGYIKTY